MNVSQYAALGFRSVGFSLLNQSDKLNDFVNWISGGRVNRSTLARDILSSAIQMGMDYAVENKSLGDRSAKIVPLAKNILIDNSREVRTEALDELLEAFCANDLQKVSADTRSSLVSVASELTGDHLLEKILTTTVQQHGWKPLETYLQNKIGAYVGHGVGKSLTSVMIGVLKHTIVDPTKFDRSDSEHFKAAAAGLKAFLDGNAAKDAVLAYSSVSAIVQSILRESADRPAMAKALFRVVSEAGPLLAVEKGYISPSAAQAILPLKKALIDGSQEEARAAIQDLAKMIAPSIAEYVPEMLALSLTDLVAASTGEHLAPQVLAAMVNDSGWEPFEDFLRQQMGSTPLAEGVIELVKEILQHEFIDTHRDPSDHNEVAKTLAVAGNAFLKGEDVTQAVLAYAPKTGWAMWLGAKGYSLSSSAFKSTKNMAYDGIDVVQQQLLLRTPLEVDANSFYRQAIENGAGKFVIDDQLRATQLADRLLMQAVEHGLPAAFADLSGSLDEAIQISDWQRDRLKNVLDQLDPAQCLPFQNSVAQISVAHSWSGKLTTASIHAHENVMLAGEKMHALSEGYNNLRAHFATQDIAGYSALGKEFVSQVGTLKLNLPPEAYTYQDTMAESANGSWNYAKSWFGYDSGLSGSNLRTFRQLYNTCDGNAAVMSEVSKVLNTEAAHGLVAEPILEALGVAGQPGVMNVNGKNVHVERASQPDIQFSVRRSDHGGVEVDISAEWAIVGYGEQGGRLREPTGTEPSVVTAKGSLIVVPSSDGTTPPAVVFMHSGASFDVHNGVSFDNIRALSQGLAAAVA